MKDFNGFNGAFAYKFIDEWNKITDKLIKSGVDWSKCYLVPINTKEAKTNDSGASERNC